MGLRQYVRDRIAEMREEHDAQIIDDLNGEMPGTTREDVLDRRGQLEGRMPQRHNSVPDHRLVDRIARMDDAERQHADGYRKDAEPPWMAEACKRAIEAQQAETHHADGPDAGR